MDNSAQPNSRWYSGSGIYRHVRLVVTRPEHVAHWGVYITTPEVRADKATVKVQTTLADKASRANGLVISTTLYDSKGVKVGSIDAPPAITREQPASMQTIVVKQPALWSPATRYLYRAVTQIRQGKTTLDEVTTNFGIRSLSWSANKGLLLSGKSVKLTGGRSTTTTGRWGLRRSIERRSVGLSC